MKEIYMSIFWTHFEGLLVVGFGTMLCIGFSVFGAFVGRFVGLLVLGEVGFFVGRHLQCLEDLEDLMDFPL